MRFSPPSPRERLQAIGFTGELPQTLRRAFDPGADFAPIPPPEPHDWLANHPEPGQSFAEFIASVPNRPDARRNRIYLQPLEAFTDGVAPSLDVLKRFAQAFFTLEVELMPVAELAADAVTTRRNPYTGQAQLLTTDILAWLRRRLPQDAFCLLGITMRDLYPDPAWNFVFGQASLRARVGVYSFARYDPRFHREPVADATPAVLLRRSRKVLAHETTHMFGIHHCIYFHCLMNGSNHLAESDARPLHLCPVDLRKLHASTGFDIGERYRGLQGFYREVGFDDETRWLAKRLAYITGE